MLKVHFSWILRKSWDFEISHFYCSDGDFRTKSGQIDSKKWLSTILSHLTQFCAKIYVSDILISTRKDRFEALWNKKQSGTPPSQNVQPEGYFDCCMSNLIKITFAPFRAFFKDFQRFADCSSVIFTPSNSRSVNSSSSNAQCKNLVFRSRRKTSVPKSSFSSKYLVKSPDSAKYCFSNASLKTWMSSEHRLKISSKISKDFLWSTSDRVSGS